MATDLEAIRHWIDGDSRRLRFTVEEEGTPRDVTGDPIEWSLYSKAYQSAQSERVISTADSDVILRRDPFVDPTAGEFEILVEETATESLSGRYWQRVVVDPQDETRQTWRGPVVIED